MGPVEADSVAAAAASLKKRRKPKQLARRMALGRRLAAHSSTLWNVHGNEQRNRCSFTRAAHEGGKTVIYQVLLANWPFPWGRSQIIIIILLVYF